MEPNTEGCGSEAAGLVAAEGGVMEASMLPEGPLDGIFCTNFYTTSRSRGAIPESPPFSAADGVLYYCSPLLRVCKGIFHPFGLGAGIFCSLELDSGISSTPECPEKLAPAPSNGGWVARCCTAGAYNFSSLTINSSSSSSYSSPISTSCHIPACPGNSPFHPVSPRLPTSGTLAYLTSPPAPPLVPTPGTELEAHLTANSSDATAPSPRLSSSSKPPSSPSLQS